ncbi:ABC transporter ATP-binding protein [Zooshikella sp. RANM57]|uniref:ABC transporter ATP-binding protein n=1 Tax=Zooshikella sp. RANM57 TaxID=3425863 RepID=UPI003D6EDA42
MMSDVIIQLQALQFAWKPNQPILHIDELTINKHHKMFIKGPSGCGKTTLLALLGGILKPQQGQITLLEQDITQLTDSQRDHFRSEHIGFIFQMFNLLPYLSVLDNITLPCRFSQKRQQRIKDKQSTPQAEAKQLVATLGLPENVLSNPVTELSIGQQQRVAAARALIGGPEIIIADEPTSALDYDARKSFLSLLFEVCDAHQATLLFVSHDPTLENLFDDTISLMDINKAASHHLNGQGNIHQLKEVS